MSVLSVSLNRGPCLYLQQKRNTQNGCGSGAGRGSEKNTKKEATLGTDGLLQGGMGKSEILLSAREPQSPTAPGHMIYIHYVIGQWWAREHLPKCNHHVERHCDGPKYPILALESRLQGIGTPRRTQVHPPLHNCPHPRQRNSGDSQVQAVLSCSNPFLPNRRGLATPRPRGPQYLHLW